MSSDRYDELLRESRNLPENPVRVAILEEAVREADSLGDERRSYEARRELINVATFAGCDDRAVVAFGWCLGYADRQGDDFHDLHSLLWSYKWIAGNVVNFPNVPRKQIESMEEDLGRRLEIEGYNRRPWLKIRWSNALDMGDLDRAVSLCEEWLTTPRDFLSDCAACDTSAHARLHFALGEDQRGIDRAAPVLEGRQSCKSVPHSTFGNVLRPLVRLDRLEEADDFQRRGYRLVARRQQHLDTVGKHLLYLVHLEHWDRAVRMFERHLGWSLESNEPSTRFDFELAGWMLFDRLAERGNRFRKLKVPEVLPLPKDDGRYRPAEIAGWLEARTLDLAARLDARNGNEAFSREIDSARRFASGA